MAGLGPCVSPGARPEAGARMVAARDDDRWPAGLGRGGSENQARTDDAKFSHDI